MSIRWKLFRVANYFLLLSFLVFAIIMTVANFKKAFPEELQWIYFAMLTMSIIIMVNSIFNIVFLTKYYPAKSIERNTKSAHSIIMICYILSLLFLLAICIVGLVEEIKDRSEDDIGILMVIFFIINLLAGIYVLVNQFILVRLIKKNYKKSLLILIDNLGES